MMASAPGDYLHFKARVPLHHIWIGGKQWRFYDYGPKEVPPLVCLSGVAGTAEVFYKLLSLSLKGYRVIAVDAPPMWSHHEWINSFEKFLDSIDIQHVHIYGTSLGGFFAQLFTQYRPMRVKSLVLSNAFLETLCFADAMPWSSLINWTPCFMLKRYILSGIREGPYEPFIADSVFFVVSQGSVRITNSNYDARPCYLTNEKVILVKCTMVSDNPEEMVHCEHLGEGYYKVLVTLARRGDVNLFRANDQLKIIQ